jgi:segregation and condensation protein B
MEDLKNIIESLLFVAEEPLSIDRIKKLLTPVGTAEIRTALGSLTEEYETRAGGFYLREVAGGYQLRTRPVYNEWVKKLLQPKPPRLSKAALETLAIVAYKQPIMRSDVEHLRGVDCGGVLRVLLERNLIRVLGRKEIPGRPLIYGTTKRFLEVFDLKDLTDLPTPKEIEELIATESDPDQVPDAEQDPYGSPAKQPSQTQQDPTVTETYPTIEDMESAGTDELPFEGFPRTGNGPDPEPDEEQPAIAAPETQAIEASQPADSKTSEPIKNSDGTSSE